jgi:hypothetical protein
MILRTLSLVIFLFTFAACAGKAVVMKDMDYSLAQLQKIVSNNLPNGLRKTSPNDREFFSKYFIFHRGKIRDATGLNQRSYAHIYVLGDRRPYNIEVHVYTERVSKGYFSIVGEEKKLAVQISQHIREDLAKGRDNRNVIDDFKPF